MTPADQAIEDGIARVRAAMEAGPTWGQRRIVIDGTCSAAWPFVLALEHSDDCSEAIAELPATHVERSTRGAPGTYKQKPARFKPTAVHDEVMANAALIAACDPQTIAHLLAAHDEREALRKRADLWRNLYRRAVNEANGLTNYVEDRPELRRAERNLTAIEAEARAAMQQEPTR